MTALTAHMAEFSPARWAEAKRVLTAESDRGISLTAAAKAAGVSVQTLRHWIKRSSERRPEDDPLIHEIHEVAFEAGAYQAAKLEDVLWDRAVNGVVADVWYKGEVVGEKVNHDNKLALALLKARDPKYRESSSHTHVVKMDASEIYERLVAAQRLGEAREGKHGIIDGKVSVVKDEGMGPLPEGAIEPDVIDAPDDQEYQDQFVLNTEAALEPEDDDTSL